jgi:hypothetical protein
MSWARKMADKHKINRVLVRCKNVKHQDKKRKALERAAKQEEKQVVYI